MTAIISYIEALFSSLPKTPDVLRMQAEMTENAEDRYNDLISQGKSEQEAIGIVISGIGTLEELKRELGIQENAAASQKVQAAQDSRNEALTEEYYAFRKKFAVAIAGAVALFILAIILGAAMDQYTHNDVLTAVGFFTPIAIGVAICIIFGLQLEEYERRLGIEEWVKRKDDRKWSGLFAGIAFPLATIAFLVAGLTQNLWHPAWIVFPVCGILTGVVSVIEEFMSKNR
ncbi:MAG: permease prefix domain 1-containing protein [Butyricicoccaceae bacterium]